MFLTKKAEETMAALIKQAKEILDGKDKFSKITDLIKDGELAKAIEMYDNIEPLEKPAFTQSKSFKSLTIDQQQAFNQAIVTNQAAHEKAEEIAGDTVKNDEDTKTTDKKSTSEVETENVVQETQDDAGSNVDITDILGDVPESDEQSKTQSTENQGSADLNSVPKEGSIFEYLHKAAAEVDEVSLEHQSIDKDMAQAVKDAVKSYIDQGLSAQEAKRNALEDVGVTGDVYYEKIADDAIATKPKAATIEDHTLNVESLLSDVAAYKPEASLDEQIVELSKSSATAYEFLNKVAELSRQANKLDEVSGKQYPGQKQYDGKMVTQGGGFGVSPQHPGQKVLGTRDGGNAAVESNFPKSAKPETDVFNKKSDKAGITSINSLDGTIAFMQPLPFEKNEMGATADYTGYVTGTMAGKKGNPNAAGPVAEAGHVTTNYLDEVYKAADKKKVAGDLPGAKASATAGFIFHGFSKTAGVTKTATPDKPLPRTFGYEPIFKSDKLNVEVRVDDRTVDSIGQSVGDYAFLLSGTPDLIATQEIVANDDGYTLGEMHFHDKRYGKTLPQVSENNETVYEKFGIDENTWADAMSAVQNDFNKRMTEADVQPHVPNVSVEVDETNPNLERDNPLQNPEHKESAENADLKKKSI